MEREQELAWGYLLLAGIFEVGFTTALRYVENFTRLLPTALFLLFATGSFVFLQKSLSSVPLGTAYAVWTGIGAAGTALLGVFAFGEPATFARLALLAALIAAVVGLKAVSP